MNLLLLNLRICDWRHYSSLIEFDLETVSSNSLAAMEELSLLCQRHILLDTDIIFCIVKIENCVYFLVAKREFQRARFKKTYGRPLPSVARALLLSVALLAASGS